MTQAPMWIRGYLPALVVAVALALSSACGAQQAQHESKTKPVSVTGDFATTKTGLFSSTGLDEV